MSRCGSRRRHRSGTSARVQDDVESRLVACLAPFACLIVSFRQHFEVPVVVAVTATRCAATTRVPPVARRGLRRPARRWELRHPQLAGALSSIGGCASRFFWADGSPDRTPFALRPELIASLGRPGSLGGRCWPFGSHWPSRAVTGKGVTDDLDCRRAVPAEAKATPWFGCSRMA
jgi:hypothetical protein